MEERKSQTWESSLGGCGCSKFQHSDQMVTVEDKTIRAHGIGRKELISRAVRTTVKLFGSFEFHDAIARLPISRCSIARRTNDTSGSDHYLPDVLFGVTHTHLNGHLLMITYADTQ